MMTRLDFPKQPVSMRATFARMDPFQSPDVLRNVPTCSTGYRRGAGPGLAVVESIHKVRVNRLLDTLPISRIQEVFAGRSF